MKILQLSLASFMLFIPYAPQIIAAAPAAYLVVDDATPATQDNRASDAAAIRASNAKFPFSFTKSPRSLTATLSLPLFDGFAREQRLQEAMASRSDARYSVRAKELALTADVTAAFLTLTTAERTVALQVQNAEKARQELKLVQDRYRVGATTFVDVQQARADYERAENDRINAVYDYHKAFAALESAVGHPLR